MNFGGFAGGFSQGLGSGIALGNAYNGAKKEYDVDQVRKKAIEEADAARGAQVAGMVKETGIGPPKATEAPTAPSIPTTGSPTNSNDPNFYSIERQRQITGQGAPIEASMLPAPAAEVTTTPVPQPTTTATQPGMPVDASATPGSVAPATPGTAPSVATPQNIAAPVPGPTIAGAPAVTPEQVATPAAAGGIPAPAMPFMVGDKGFKTRSEAMAHAETQVGSRAEFSGKAVAKKLEQHFIEKGDIAQAEKWGAWSKNKDNEKKMETWADAFKMAQNGDHVGSAKKLMKLYPDYNDGMTLVKSEPVKDANGKETGFKMTVRDAEGKERTVEHDAQTISRVGLQQMNPQKMFEMDHAEQTAASTARAKASADAANDRRTLNKELVVEGVKAKTAATAATVKNERDIEHSSIKSQLDEAKLGAGERKKVDTKIDYLKRSGYTEEQINGMMPVIVGAGEHKKVTDPTERRAIIATELAKDPAFARKPVADKNKAVDEMMSVIHGPSGNGVSPSNMPPAAAGIGKPPAATAPNAPVDKGKGKGTPFMTPDGKVVYL